MALGVLSAAALATPALAKSEAKATESTTATARACDSSLQQAFVGDPHVKVVLARPFLKGEKLRIADREFTPIEMMGGHTTASKDVCLVKVLVGPGNPGPEGAPSTSPGIGMEIWLPKPEDWNGRLHALGGGGFDGGPHGSPDRIAELRAAGVALTEGAVSVHSDGGHPRSGGLPGQESGGGDWAMNPDGTLSTALLTDFASRTMHEMAVKSKALAAYYYGHAPRYSYWEGSSNGGRQAYVIAQKYPDDFDGIIGNMPALNWSQTLIADLYPQIVFQRDLGGRPLTEAQQDLVSNAAIKACDVVGGRHMGYILDMAACRYDATKDREVLCKSSGGKNNTPDCVTREQALAINKIWYGPTEDGSVPDPALDNGWDSEPEGKRRWYGFPRGTSLYNAMFSRLFSTNAGVANVSGPFTHATDSVALALQNPTMASTNFRNATGNGQDMWKTLSYAQLANAMERSLALQPVMGHIDSNDPDLSAFKASGGKFLSWHGVHDEALPVQGTIHYYDRVVQAMGGLDNVRDFFKFYIVPGVGHATPNGSSNSAANPPGVDQTAFYRMLTDWVERGIEPGSFELATPPMYQEKRSYPACPYPQRAEFVSGDPTQAESFSCTGAD